MCHFHQKITLHPKLEASQDLKKIMIRLKYSDEIRFTKALDIWYKNHKKLNLTNTTNLIEGRVFSPLKILIKIHRGLSKNLKLKIVDDYLVSYKKRE